MRVPQHLVDRRREELRGLIRRDGFLPVARSAAPGGSEATARRDLVAIEASGHITRTHGGALADYNANLRFPRGARHPRRTAKGRIAAAAARLIPDQGTVFLDAARRSARRPRDPASQKPFPPHRRHQQPARRPSSAATRASSCTCWGVPSSTARPCSSGEDSIRSLNDWKFAAAFLGGEGMTADGIANSHEQITAFQRARPPEVRRPLFPASTPPRSAAPTPYRVSGWDPRVHLITDASADQLAAAGINPRTLVRAS